MDKTSVQDVDENDQLTDSGCNWSQDVLRQLAMICCHEFEANPDCSRVLRLYSDRDCSQRKAVDDKLYLMKQMYHFISQVKNQFNREGIGKKLSSL
ncbi:unnamed protein product [Peronospora belbahrii]|uniref:Uncharacterized protein n=1 Tax=Peronospora belbahrii TaxID=622444 RepID=A0AAU9KS06_9STRA|nr:unnamed protein product [Peronospora belbahrii]CAH0513320.1 unnamed protein product [Peronospora belbahrii]